MKNKPKIAWVTADYFIDCDIDIINGLLDRYNIDWFIILPRNNARYNETQIKNVINNSVNLHFIYDASRFRSIRKIKFYYSLCKRIEKIRSDVTYINMQGFPYLFFIASFFLKRRKTIFTVHQSVVHGGMKYKKLTSIYFKLLYSWFSYFHLYSESQAKSFREKYSNKNIFIIPLGLKSFGEKPKTNLRNKIVFLNFGTILKNKNIKSLILASNNLYEKGYSNFTTKIVGHCDNWEEYSQLIKYPQVFDLNINAISNQEIPELFSSVDYLVLPYSQVSQSGPLKIAFNYNVPVIASDLDEFKYEIENDYSGYLFECNNISSLTDVLAKAINNYSYEYENLRKGQKQLVDERYSGDIILSKYIETFNFVLNAEKN